MSALATIEDRLPTLADQFNAVLSDRSINFTRECSYAVQLLTANEYTAKVAAANLASLDAATVEALPIDLISACCVSVNGWLLWSWWSTSTRRPGSVNYSLHAEMHSTAQHVLRDAHDRYIQGPGEGSRPSLLDSR